MRLTRPPVPVNWVGFDSLFNELDRLSSGADCSPNWPPYNIKKIGDLTFVIEIAVAGFSTDDIDITSKENELVIKGKQPSLEEKEEYLHKGIAERSFSRTFTLADSVFVKDAAMVNGMLKIFLEKVVPPEKQVRTIKVQSLGHDPDKMLSA